MQPVIKHKFKMCFHDLHGFSHGILWIMFHGPLKFATSPPPTNRLDANSSKPCQSQGPSKTTNTTFGWESRALTPTWSQPLARVWNGHAARSTLPCITKLSSIDYAFDRLTLVVALEPIFKRPLQKIGLTQIPIDRVRVKGLQRQLVWPLDEISRALTPTWSRPLARMWSGPLARPPS